MRKIGDLDLRVGVGDRTAEDKRRNTKLCWAFGWLLVGAGVLAIGLSVSETSGCSDRPVLQLLNEQAGYPCAGSLDRPVLRLLNRQ